MKKTVLILFVLICQLFANDQLTLVGVSGSEQKISAQKINDSTYAISPYQVWSLLYLTRSQKKDTLRVTYDKRDLSFVVGAPKTTVLSQPFQLKKPLYRKNDTLWLDAHDFATTMATHCQKLSFRFDTQQKKIFVTKTGSEKTKEVSKKIVTATTAVLSPAWMKLSETVVLDPGHGGQDPGAIGPTGLQEKDVVLSITLHTKNFLEKQSKVKVVLTRATDVFIPLGGRTKIANNKKASLFVSIHANATEDGEASGYKMYFLSDAKNESDQRTAMLENAAMEFESTTETDVLHSVLLDMMSSEFLKESQDLSITLAQTFGSDLAQKKLHTGIGQANFYVLHGASMPAVLVETAFISNKQEEKLLRDVAFQKSAGEAIGRAILTFLQTMGEHGE